jgi:hypothetical protein
VPVPPAPAAGAGAADGEFGRPAALPVAPSLERRIHGVALGPAGAAGALGRPRAPTAPAIARLPRRARPACRVARGDPCRRRPMTTQASGHRVACVGHAPPPGVRDRASRLFALCRPAPDPGRSDRAACGAARAGGAGAGRGAATGLPHQRHLTPPPIPASVTGRLRPRLPATRRGGFRPAFPTCHRALPGRPAARYTLRAAA